MLSQPQSEIVNNFKAPIHNFKNYLLPNYNQILRSTIATIDLEKIRNNVKITKKYIHEKFNPKAKLMAIVKANCYGHGAVNIVPDMVEAGVDRVGVAALDEGIELRINGIREVPILLLGVWEAHVAPLFFEHNITPVVYSVESAEILNSTAKQLGTTIIAHIKVDTGMGRVGFLPEEFRNLQQNPENFKKLFSNIQIEGFMTHMSSADMSTELEFTRNQNILFEEIYKEFCEFLENKLQYTKEQLPMAHFSNSSTSLKTEKMPFVGDLYRVGDVLYGGKRGEYDDVNWYWNHQPALEWSTAITSIKEFPVNSSIGYCRAYITHKENTKIAILPVGYADGICTSLSNKGKMIVETDDGELYTCPIRGRVCMDLLMIEVTDVPNVRVGNKVYIVGKGLTQEDVAELADTNPSAITCNIGLRIPRIYINSVFPSKVPGQEQEIKEKQNGGKLLVQEDSQN